MSPDPMNPSTQYIPTAFDTKDEIVAGILSGKGITQRIAMKDRTVRSEERRVGKECRL